MRKITLLIIAALLLPAAIHRAEAQSIVVLPNGCGTANEANVNVPYLTVDAAGHLCGGQSSGTVITNCGGTITAGGQAQQLFTAAQFKHGFLLEIGTNDSNTDPLYFADSTTTTTPGPGVAGSFSIAASSSTLPGGSFSSPLNMPVGVTYYINGATTGDAYKCRVW